MTQLEPVLVSVNEAAAALRLSRATFYKLLNSGAVRAVKSGKRTLVSTKALREYAETLSAYEPAVVGSGRAISLRDDVTA